MCERRTESHLRALLLQALTACGLAPTGLQARHEDDDQLTSLCATITAAGLVGDALEQVISRLSPEPGVRDLPWHLDDADESERHRHRVLT